MNKVPASLSTCISFTSKECLVILRRQIHVVVSERLLLGGLLEAEILRAPEQVQRVPPDLALGYGRGAGAGLGRVAASQPGRDMIEGDLLDEGCPVSAVIPPLEDQDQPGDEGAGPGQGHVELRGQGG